MYQKIGGYNILNERQEIDYSNCIHNKKKGVVRNVMEVVHPNTNGKDNTVRTVVDVLYAFTTNEDERVNSVAVPVYVSTIK